MHREQAVLLQVNQLVSEYSNYSKFNSVTILYYNKSSSLRVGFPSSKMCFLGLSRFGVVVKYMSTECAECGRIRHDDIAIGCF